MIGMKNGCRSVAVLCFIWIYKAVFKPQENFLNYGKCGILYKRRIR